MFKYEDTDLQVVGLQCVARPHPSAKPDRLPKRQKGMFRLNFKADLLRGQGLSSAKRNCRSVFVLTDRYVYEKNPHNSHGYKGL